MTFTAFLFVQPGLQFNWKIENKNNILFIKDNPDDVYKKVPLQQFK